MAGRELTYTSRATGSAEIRNSAGKIGPWIDVRGRGGLVVSAGSAREGKRYELADDRHPVPLPSWLAELASRQEPPADTARDVTA